MLARLDQRKLTVACIVDDRELKTLTYIRCQLVREWTASRQYTFGFCHA